MTNDLSHAVDKAEPSLVVLESETFAAFEQWMDEELDRLVARWIHTAAPNANRCDRAQRQFGRKPSHEAK